ncbi:MAG: type II toxin-antitoxin system PemK/MazF family toxin [Candidatus Aminicenantes bacterium]|nr:type II toxin-antitoxin system PemK/MazF family toxin [Candidatus Aminicenantes bacterium]
MKQIFYTPQRGDVVWISLAPQAGQKQTARHPAVVLSTQAYNSRVGLAVLCPITSIVKGYPFEVLIPPGMPINGAVLADQAKSLDWHAHRAELVCSLPPAVIDEALGKLRTLLA